MPVIPLLQRLKQITLNSRPQDYKMRQQKAYPNKQTNENNNKPGKRQSQVSREPVIMLKERYNGISITSVGYIYTATFYLVSDT